MQPYPETVRILYVCQPPCPAVPHVEPVSEQGVAVVCLIAFFRAAQRRAFGAHVEFSARCYRREGHGTSVLHAQHRHAFVLEALHRAVVPAVCPVSEPSLVFRVGIPRPRPFQRQRRGEPEVRAFVNHGSVYKVHRLETVLAQVCTQFLCCREAFLYLCILEHLVVECLECLTDSLASEFYQ